MSGVHDACLSMAASKVLPSRFSRPALLAEAERLLGENEPVGMGVSEGESVVVSARLRTEGHLGLHPWGDAVATEQLIVGASMPLHELAERARPQHPAQQLEETHEIGLPRSVGPEQHTRRAQVRKLDVRQRPESTDPD